MPSIIQRLGFKNVIEYAVLYIVAFVHVTNAYGYLKSVENGGNIHALQIILCKGGIKNCAVLQQMEADCKKMKCDTGRIVIR